MRRVLGAIVALSIVAAAAATSAGASHLPRSYELRLSARNLTSLETSFYEVWVVYGDRKISAGSFNVDSKGKLVDGFGHAARFFSPRRPTDADAVVVTIEPSPDPSPAPSGIVVLSGKPGAHAAKLAFPVDLKQIAGSFILATPTDSSVSNETAGVWFLDPAAGPGPSLRLPTLPGGWAWEGWGVTQDTPLSTGRFTSPSGADSSSLFSGPNAAPPFPGEDFLSKLPAGVTAPVSLADGSSLIVLSIEPDLNGSDPTGPGPFSIKPLVTKVASGAADHQSIQLGRDLSGVPAGTARF